MEFKSGEIRIGIPPIVGAAFFSKLISQYKEKYPLVKITLTEVGTKKIKKGVEEGSLDIGLICTLPAQGSSFEIINVIKDPLMVIVHRDHALASEKDVLFSELKNEPFILYGKDFTLYDLIIEECSKNNGLIWKKDKYLSFAVREFISTSQRYLDI